MVEPLVEQTEERDEGFARVVSDHSRVAVEGEPETGEGDINHRRYGHVVELLRHTEPPARNKKRRGEQKKKKKKKGISYHTLRTSKNYMA